MGLLTFWIESLYEPNKITEQCLRYISPKSECSVCVKICPTDAITINEDKKPSIELKRCNECQRCVTGCPSLAIDGRLPKRKYFEHTLVMGVEDPLPMERELLFLYKQGMRHIYTGDRRSHDFSPLQEVVSNMNRSLSITGNQEIQFTETLPEIEEADQTVTRRELFIQMKEKSRRSLIENYTPASWRSNHKLLDLNKLFPDTAFFNISIDQDTCIICGICTTLCPEKCFAITSENEEHYYVLSHHKCIGCSLCIDVCPEKSITVRPHVSNGQLKQYINIHQIECDSCGEKYFTWNKEKSNCQPCFRKKQYMS